MLLPPQKGSKPLACTIYGLVQEVSEHGFLTSHISYITRSTWDAKDHPWGGGGLKSHDLGGGRGFLTWFRDSKDFQFFFQPQERGIETRRRRDVNPEVLGNGHFPITVRITLINGALRTQVAHPCTLLKAADNEGRARYWMASQLTLNDMATPLNQIPGAGQWKCDEGPIAFLTVSEKLGDQQAEQLKDPKTGQTWEKFIGEIHPRLPRDDFHHDAFFEQPTSRDGKSEGPPS